MAAALSLARRASGNAPLGPSTRGGSIWAVGTDKLLEHFKCSAAAPYTSAKKVPAGRSVLRTPAHTHGRLRPVPPLLSSPFWVPDPEGTGQAGSLVGVPAGSPPPPRGPASEAPRAELCTPARVRRGP